MYIYINTDVKYEFIQKVAFYMHVLRITFNPN